MTSILGSRPLPARTAYLWWEGGWSLLHSVAFTLSMLFQVQVAHLSPAELLIVGAAMEASCFLFEIPTSIVAHLYSRRLSVLIGGFVVGCGTWVRTSAQAVAGPVQAAWLQRNVDSRARATTVSLTSQAEAFGQIVGGPPLGALAGRTSISTAMVVAAGLLAPAAALFARLRPAGAVRPAIQPAEEAK